MIRQIAFYSAMCVMIGCGPQPSAEREGSHTHAATTTVTIWTEATEIFFEYPAMIAGGPGAPWAVHVTRLEDFSPVTEGVLTLAFRSPDGTVFTTRSEAPARPGIFMPAPQLPAPGEYDLVVDIDGVQLKDRIRAGTVQVYASDADAPPEEEGGEGAISFLKEQQWPIEFGTAPAIQREVRVSVEASGVISAAANRLAEVTSPVSGLASFESNAAAPAAGDRVQRGGRLMTLAPTRQDDSYARAVADVERLSREVERLQQLYDGKVAPERRLTEAKHDLEIARAGLDAMGEPGEEGYRYTVRAPIGGVVQERWFTPGARVDAGQPLYTIVDPSVVWLEVRLPARYAAQAAAFRSAGFSVEGSSRRYTTSRTVSIGSVIDATNRTLPLRFAVENSEASLKIGLLARVRLFGGEAVGGVAIPDEAIMTEDGLPVAYVQVGGESFERRVLTLGPSEGGFTLVEEGIDENDRLVIKGGYQVYLASLNTNEISDHGHPH